MTKKELKDLIKKFERDEKLRCKRAIDYRKKKK